MHKEMRKKKRQLSNEETYNILINGEYGILSTSSSNQPYGVPLSYCVIDNAIYFHCALTGHKLENIETNNNVCFTVVGKTQPVFEEEAKNFSTYYESVVVFGKCLEVVDSEEKIEALKVLCEKYLIEHMKHFTSAIEKTNKILKVYKIEIDHITGKAKKQ